MLSFIIFVMQTKHETPTTRYISTFRLLMRSSGTTSLVFIRKIVRWHNVCVYLRARSNALDRYNLIMSYRYTYSRLDYIPIKTILLLNGNVSDVPYGHPRWWGFAHKTFCAFHVSDASVLVHRISVLRA